MAGITVIALVLFAVAWLDLVVASWFFTSIGLFVLAVVLPLAVLLFLYVRVRSRQPAAVNTGWRLGNALEITNPDKPAFVQNAQIPAAILRLGLMALGGPGSGKTESVLLGYLKALPEHAPGSGVAVFEGKGDIDIYKKCVAMGCPPDHFFSTELPGSATLNLMQGEAHDVLDRLTRLLIGQTVLTSYYADAQRAVLATVIPLLTGINVSVNLRDLYAALAIPDAGVELIRRARDARIDAAVIALAEQWYQQKAETRIAEIRGLLNKLFIFCHGPYTDRLNAYQPDINISVAVQTRERLYFHLPLSEFSRDVAIAIIDMFGVEARRRQLAGAEQFSLYPLILDDWGGFFHDGFGPFSARCRSAAMPLSFSFQSLAQVKAVSQTFADELDDNLATKIILRVQGEDTAAFALRLLGDYDAFEVSTSQLAERAGTALGVSQRARLNARELRELAEGEAYVSTLIRDGSRMINPLWRVRLPRPAFDHWQAVTLPPARSHAQGTGLGLWQRYIDSVSPVLTSKVMPAAPRKTPNNKPALAGGAEDFEVIEL